MLGKVVPAAIVGCWLMAAPALVAAEQLTWTLKSNYQYRVQWKLYSTSRGHVWPDVDHAWGLDDYKSHTETINCIAGENVCYGAWNTGAGSLYWGVGPDHTHHCTNCCTTCDGGSVSFVLD